MDKDKIIDAARRCYKAAQDWKDRETAIPIPWGPKGNELKRPFALLQDWYEGKHSKNYQINGDPITFPVSSKGFQVVEGNTTFITDNRAHVEFLPVGINDDKIADKVQRAYNLWRDKSGFDITHIQSVRESRKFGASFFGLFFDEKAPFGQKIEVIPIDQISLAPGTTFSDFHEKEGVPYLFYEYLATPIELKRLFKNADFKDFDPKWSLDGKTRRSIKPWTDDSTIENLTQQCMVYEWWIRDDAQEVIMTETDDYLIETKKPKYPNGRRIFMAGGIVLQDGKNPYPHGKFPFIPVVAYPQAGKFYSASDLSLTLAATYYSERAMQVYFDGVIRAGGGKHIVRDKSGINPNDITNEVGQVLTSKDPRNDYAVVAPPSPNRNLLELTPMFEREADGAAGVHDISRGVSNPGNRSASEVMTLADSDKTRIRSAVRSLGWTNTEIATQWLANLQNAGDFEEYILIEDDTGRTAVPFAEADIKQDPELGDEFLRFHVSVEDTSTLPQTAQDRYNETLQLFGMGLLDPIAVYERLRIPGWQRMMERINAQQAQEVPEEPEDEQALLEAAMAEEGMMLEGDPSIEEANRMAQEALMAQLSGGHA